MTSSSRDQTPAEHRAAVEAAARTRLDDGKQALEALRTRELAEAEALSLARIRIQTDQMLAKQAEALRDAEHKAEMVAIERRTADLDAAKEARRRQEMEEQARHATEAKNVALQAAAVSAKEKAAALEQLAQYQTEQRLALEAMKVAARTESSLRWKARWLSLRLMAAWKLAAITLMVGLVAGYVYSANHRDGSIAAISAVADAIYTDSDRGLAPALHLDRELQSAPR